MVKKSEGKSIGHQRAGAVCPGIKDWRKWNATHCQYDLSVLNVNAHILPWSSFFTTFPASFYPFFFLSLCPLSSSLPLSLHPLFIPSILISLYLFFLRITRQIHAELPVNSADMLHVFYLQHFTCSYLRRYVPYCSSDCWSGTYKAKSRGSF